MPVAERPKQTRQAFPVALRLAIVARKTSYRSLADKTPYGFTYIEALTSGRKQPTVENIEVIAAALDLPPEHFREYREHLVEQAARRLVDQHGAEAVLAKLAELDG